MPSKLLFAVVYAAVSVSGSQKGDNFWVMDFAFIGPFDITTVSQYDTMSVTPKARMNH